VKSQKSLGKARAPYINEFPKASGRLMKKDEYKKWQQTQKDGYRGLSATLLFELAAF
jgi:hypothetical protein